MLMPIQFQNIPALRACLWILGQKPEHRGSSAAQSPDASEEQAGFSVVVRACRAAKDLDGNGSGILVAAYLALHSEW
jgi:hypothetical protein